MFRKTEKEKYPLQQTHFEFSLFFLEKEKRLASSNWLSIGRLV